MESLIPFHLLQRKAPQRNSRLLLACCLLTSALGGAATPARAQYTVTESPAEAAASAAATTANNATAGPVRLARFAYVSGNVTWRPDDTTEWSPATVNLPVRQGAQFWITGGGRAEIQFDDGSLLRLGNNALVTLQTLYSDKDGEFTEIKLNSGLISLRLRTEHSIYQVDTPLVSAKATGPAKIRLGAGAGAAGDVEVAVNEGQANIEGGRGTRTVQAGQYLHLDDANTPYLPIALPAADSWERWNEERDDWDNGADRPTHRYVPENIGIVAGDLDHYGDWRDDPQYGHVWCPRVSGADWRPYYNGHWTWVSPFGWTWVSDEPWGWAPYHYGTWIHAGYGWAWVPGPVNQYWCPAVVNFCEYNGGIGWCPLAPFEVRYPSAFNLGFGFGGRRWSAFFSIGCAGYYYPYGGYCLGYPWDTSYLNRARFSLDIGLFSHHPYWHGGGRAFIPYNARLAAGGSFATFGAFGGHGRYEPLGRGRTDIFAHGREFVGPGAGRGPIGPFSVRPTLLSASPARRFETGVRPASALVNRSVVRAALRPSVARVSARPGIFNSHGARSYSASDAARHARSGLGWTPGNSASHSIASGANAASGRATYGSGNRAEIGSVGRQSATIPTSRTSDYGAYGRRDSTAGSYAGAYGAPSRASATARSDSGYRNRDDGGSSRNDSGGRSDYGGRGSFGGRSDYGGGRGGFGGGFGGGGGRHR